MSPATRWYTLAAFGLLVAPATAAAQLPASSAAAIGLGQTYTAAARGYEAIQWNPALLGMPDRPGFSLGLLQSSLEARNNSFSFGDLRKYRNDTLTTADKDTILMKIRKGTTDRALAFNLGAGVTGFGLSVGNFGLSFSGAGSADLGVSADAVELALFGNAAYPNKVYTGQGTGASGWGGATLAIAYGRQLNVVPVGTLAVGATFKYTYGIAIGLARDMGTSLQSSPSFNATLAGQALGTDVTKSTHNGTGVGLDVGGVYQLASGLRFGLSIENLISKMSWKDDNLLYYRYAYQITQNGSQFSDMTIAKDSGVAYNPNDPNQLALHDSLFAHANFPMRVHGGVRFDPGPVTLMGDAMVQLRSGLGSTTTKRVSAGAELTAIPVIRLRAGLATDFNGGITLAGGVGLKAGPVRLDASVANTTGGDRQGAIVAVGLGIMN